MANADNTSLPNETWKPVVGWEGRYEVSDQGRVKSLERRVPSGPGRTRIHKERVLKNQYKPAGYPYVNLCGLTPAPRAFYIHDLLLTAFVGPRPSPKHVARHLDDNKDRNTLDNLTWGTESENAYDKVRNGNDHYAKRDSCVNGHEFTPDNIARNPKYPGTRYCKACAREAQARRGDKIVAYKSEYAERIASGHVPEVVKPLCKRGHRLEEPNLMPSQLPERQCLACSRGRAAARRKNDPDNLQAYCDAYYEKLMQ